MLRTIAGARGAILLAAIVAALAGGARADGRPAFHDAPAALAVGQVDGLHRLAAGRLARLRSLRPETAALPSAVPGGPGRRVLAGNSLPALVAGVPDLPLYAGGYGDLGLWSGGFGHRSGVPGAGGALGFAGALAGGGFGIDRALGERWTVGAAVAAASATIDWEAGGGTDAAAGTGAAVYASYAASGVFLDLSLSAGVVRTMADPPPGNGSGRAHGAVGGRVDAGFDLGIAGVDVRPIASATVIATAGPDRAGPHALLSGIGDDGPRQVQMRLGLRLSRELDLGGRPLALDGGLTWRRDLTLTPTWSSDSDGGVRATRKVRLERNSVEPQVGLVLQLTDGLEVFGRYHGRFGSDAERHAVTGGLRATF